MVEETEVIALLPMDLEHLSKGALRMLAQDASVEAGLLQQILLQEKDDPETVRCLIRNPSLPDEAFDAVAEDLSEELRLEVENRQKALVVYGDGAALSTKRVRQSASSGGGAADEGSLQKRIYQMSPVQKITTALKGPKEARSLLIRDPNKEIALTVLKNPKISDSEIEFYAASTSVTEEVQREIGKNREWCKRYSVVKALVFNPKTPVGISIQKLQHIQSKDLQFLSKSRNVPSAVRSGAKRLIAKKQRKQG